MPRAAGVFAMAAALSLVCAAARASCLVTNETGYEFVVSSGNAANQKVGPHATTTIEAGKIQGKSAEGRTISGSCKDGARLVVREKNGVPLLLPRK
ncbi:MAG TPA: hypothetical protein VHL80_12225 [Polyangia bacterium]|nr:hypothetical protein [Polyangia bacterium]